MAQRILANMGMAVAESLVVLRAFGGTLDMQILWHVEERWHLGKTRLYHGAPGQSDAYNGFLG